LPTAAWGTRYASGECTAVTMDFIRKLLPTAWMLGGSSAASAPDTHRNESADVGSLASAGDGFPVCEAAGSVDASHPFVALHGILSDASASAHRNVDDKLATAERQLQVTRPLISGDSNGLMDNGAYRCCAHTSAALHYSAVVRLLSCTIVYTDAHAYTFNSSATLLHSLHPTTRAARTSPSAHLLTGHQTLLCAVSVCLSHGFNVVANYRNRQPLLMWTDTLTLGKVEAIIHSYKGAWVHPIRPAFPVLEDVLFTYPPAQDNGTRPAASFSVQNFFKLPKNGGPTVLQNKERVPMFGSHVSAVAVHALLSQPAAVIDVLVAFCTHFSVVNASSDSALASLKWNALAAITALGGTPPTLPPSTPPMATASGTEGDSTRVPASWIARFFALGDSSNLYNSVAGATGDGRMVIPTVGDSQWRFSRLSTSTTPSIILQPAHVEFLLRTSLPPNRSLDFSGVTHNERDGTYTVLPDGFFSFLGEGGAAVGLQRRDVYVNTGLGLVTLITVDGTSMALPYSTVFDFLVEALEQSRAIALRKDIKDGSELQAHLSIALDGESTTHYRRMGLPVLSNLLHLEQLLAILEHASPCIPSTRHDCPEAFEQAMNALEDKTHYSHIVSMLPSIGAPICAISGRWLPGSSGDRVAGASGIIEEIPSSLLSSISSALPLDVLFDVEATSSTPPAATASTKTSDNLHVYERRGFVYVLRSAHCSILHTRGGRSCSSCQQYKRNSLRFVRGGLQERDARVLADASETGAIVPQRVGINNISERRGASAVFSLQADASTALPSIYRPITTLTTSDAIKSIKALRSQVKSLSARLEAAEFELETQRAAAVATLGEDAHPFTGTLDEDNVDPDLEGEALPTKHQSEINSILYSPNFETWVNETSDIRPEARALMRAQFKLMHLLTQPTKEARNKRRGFRWPAIAIKLALRLRQSCGRSGYHELSRILALPSDRSLQRVTSAYNVPSGIHPESFDLLALLCNQLGIPTPMRLFNLQMDEMYIKSGILICRRTGEPIGLADNESMEATTAALNMLIDKKVSDGRSQRKSLNSTARALRDEAASVRSRASSVGSTATDATPAAGAQAGVGARGRRIIRPAPAARRAAQQRTSRNHAISYAESSSDDESSHDSDSSTSMHIRSSRQNNKIRSSRSRSRGHTSQRNATGVRTARGRSHTPTPADAATKRARPAATPATAAASPTTTALPTVKKLAPPPPPLAKRALVMMASSVCARIRQPVAYFLVDSLNAHFAVVAVKGALLHLYRVGTTTVCITSDGYSSFLAMQNAIAVPLPHIIPEASADTQLAVLHPVTGLPVLFIPDPDHKIKCFSNALFKTTPLRLNGHEITIKHLRDYELQSRGKVARIGKGRLSQCHTFPGRSERMVVLYAIQRLLFCTLLINELGFKTDSAHATAVFALCAVLLHTATTSRDPIRDGCVCANGTDSKESNPLVEAFAEIRKLEGWVTSGQLRGNMSQLYREVRQMVYGQIAIVRLYIETLRTGRQPVEIADLRSKNPTISITPLAGATVYDAYLVLANHTQTDLELVFSHVRSGASHKFGGNVVDVQQLRERLASISACRAINTSQTGGTRHNKQRQDPTASSFAAPDELPARRQDTGTIVYAGAELLPSTSSSHMVIGISGGMAAAGTSAASTIANGMTFDRDTAYTELQMADKTYEHIKVGPSKKSQDFATRRVAREVLRRMTTAQTPPTLLGLDTVPTEYISLLSRGYLWYPVPKFLSFISRVIVTAQFFYTARSLSLPGAERLLGRLRELLLSDEVIRARFKVAFASAKSVGFTDEGISALFFVYINICLKIVHQNLHRVVLPALMTADERAANKCTLRQNVTIKQRMAWAKKTATQVDSRASAEAAAVAGAPSTAPVSAGRHVAFAVPTLDSLADLSDFDPDSDIED